MKKIVRIVILLIAVGLAYYYFPTTLSSSKMNGLLSTVQSKTFSNSNYAVLIDYSLPVFRKRLWLVDIKRKKVILNCHVSHAEKSGFFWPRKYSNKPGSELSCTGKFEALNTYESNYGEGAFKIGLRIKGLDTNNKNALKRNIVFHSSFPWWSKGCFMTSEKNNRFIANKIKKGGLVLVLP